MQEAVTFPKPEEVNIIATRNGELTNIPGTEFRTPLSPYITSLKFWDKYLDIHFTSDDDVTVIPIAFYCKSGWQKLPFAKCVGTYEKIVSHSHVEMKATYFSAQLTGEGSPPAINEELGVLVQLIGNKTTHEIDNFYEPSDEPFDIVLPPAHSERILLRVKNQIDPGWYLPE